MNLLDKISENEYEMLTIWRREHGLEDEVDSSYLIPIKSLLAIWDENNQTLFKLLGNNLSISKEVDYVREEDELLSEICEMTDGRGRFGRSERQGYIFVSNFYDWFYNTFPLPSSHWSPYRGRFYDSPEDEELSKRNCKIRDGFSDLISNWCLACNEYKGSEFTFPLADGKEYTVREGVKPLRVLKKIADSYDIAGYEDFRICHSLVHNQKHLKGTMHLSIHPLDYWTMSDNECGWDSCMNWRDAGGYRMGTVEMMNSPKVVVAYMDSSETLAIDRDLKWNSKKWRQLFIVDKDVILAVKPYPYANHELTKTVMNWLKELAETNLGWSYFGDEDESPIKYAFKPFSNPNHLDKPKIYFEFRTNAMYNDVGSCDYHAMYVGNDVYDGGDIQNNNYKIQRHDSCEPSPVEVLRVGVNYSGETQCIVCGGTSESYADQSYLCCRSCCYDRYSCGRCGSNTRDGYLVDDIYLCEDCYYNDTDQCIISGERYFNEDLETIRLRIPISDKFIDEHNLRRNSSENVYALWDEAVFVHPNYFHNFTLRFLKEGRRIKKFAKHYTNEYYIDIDDLRDPQQFIDQYLTEMVIDVDNVNYDKLAKDTRGYIMYYSV